MSGSHLAVIVMPIVIALGLITWLSLVLYAANHPLRRRSGVPLRNEVAGGAFDAFEGGRQLMPIPEQPADAERHAEAFRQAPATGSHAARDRAVGAWERAYEPPADQIAAAAREQAAAMVVQPHLAESQLIEEPPVTVPPARTPAAAAGQGEGVPAARQPAEQPSTQEAAREVGRHLVGAARGMAGIAAGLRHRR
ncbi:MAG TPA: hypothetical protein VGI58_08885 [Streptosporangiaceae bacterium]|jgi:hypothetical protein